MATAAGLLKGFPPGASIAAHLALNSIANIKDPVRQRNEAAVSRASTRQAVSGPDEWVAQQDYFLGDRAAWLQAFEVPVH